MRCEHCGKENPENTLFCGYCGKPLTWEDDENEAPPKSADEPILKQPIRLSAKRPPELSRPAPVDTRSDATIVPKRELKQPDPDDIFMEQDDEFEPEPPKRVVREGYAYDEPEPRSFFMRHIRGIVSLMLLGLTVIIVLIWLNSAGGQRLLAQFHLSGKPASYVLLGDEAYSKKAYQTAGAYYDKALSLDPDNYQYAVRAVNSYIYAGDNEKAAQALYKCIDLRPNSADAYLTLLSLYPDASTRPQKVSELLRQGYSMTGDARLNR